MDVMETEEIIIPNQVAFHAKTDRILSVLKNSMPEHLKKTVIIMRCGLADGILHPQNEVTRQTAISRSYVSRIKKALATLRSSLEEVRKQSDDNPRK